MEYGASKKRKKQIDQAVESAMGAKPKPKVKAKKKPSGGGMGGDSISKILERLKREQDKKAGIKRN